MANRIEKSLTEAQMTEVRASLNQVYDVFKANCVTLTGSERNLLPSARNNYEKYLSLLLQIANDCNVNLQQFSPEAIAADLKMQADMSLLLDQLGTLYTMALDSYRAARAEGWKAFLGLYNILNILSDQDAELKGRMKTIVDFMAHGSRKQGSDPKEAKDLAQLKGEDAPGDEGDSTEP